MPVTDVTDETFMFLIFVGRAAPTLSGEDTLALCAETHAERGIAAASAITLVMQYMGGSIASIIGASRSIGLDKNADPKARAFLDELKRLLLLPTDISEDRLVGCRLIYTATATAAQVAAALGHRADSYEIERARSRVEECLGRRLTTEERAEVEERFIPAPVEP